MSAQATPRWSVVVPTYNRPARLAECVAALTRLLAPEGGFEIVVVNDGGMEPPDTLRAAAPGNAVGVRFISQPNAGAGEARNHGAKVARGEWLAFTDDDCAPVPDWLLRLEEALKHEPGALVGGPVRNALTGNLFCEASQRLAEYAATYFDGNQARERFFTSNNIAVAKAAFLEAGGFDTRFGRGAAEDREFTDRWYAQGRPSARVPGAEVRHSHELSLRTFLKQHHSYGKGAHNFRAVRRESGRPVRIDLPFYAGSLSNAKEGGGLRGLALAGLTVAAHGAYLTGLALATLRRRKLDGAATAHPSNRATESLSKGAS